MKNVKEISIDQKLFIAIILTAIILRLYALYNMAVIQSDGIAYIYQAKAIASFRWDALQSCRYDFISLYPFMIAVFHLILPDWEMAAGTVSLIFGTATIVPMYLMLKRLVSKKAALMSIFIFAVNPVFVKESVEIMKDPMFWFLAATGLLIFVRTVDRQNGSRMFILSSILFCASALVRAEGLFLLLGSVVYLSFGGRKSVRGLLYFCMPFFLLTILIIMSAFLQKDGVSLWSIYVSPRFDDMSRFISFNPFDNALTHKLAVLHEQGFLSEHKDFIVFVKDSIWIIGIGVLLMRIWEIYYLIFLIPFILGVRGIIKRIKEDRRIAYLVVLSIVSLSFLYIFTLRAWIMPRRYLTVFYLSSFFLVALGIENIMEYLVDRLKRKRIITFALIILIFIATVPDIARPIREDNLPYREIGENIALRSSGGATKIASPSRWVSYYALKDNDSLVCPMLIKSYKRLFKKPYPELVKSLRQNNYDYFLWRGLSGSKDDSVFLEQVSDSELLELGVWEVKGKKIVLFAVQKDQ